MGFHILVGIRLRLFHPRAKWKGHPRQEVVFQRRRRRGRPVDSPANKAVFPRKVVFPRKAAFLVQVDILANKAVFPVRLASPARVG